MSAAYVLSQGPWAPSVPQSCGSCCSETNFGRAIQKWFVQFVRRHAPKCRGNFRVEGSSDKRLSFASTWSCLFRTCRLRASNHPALCPQPHIKWGKVRRPGGIIAREKYGTASAVICANYVLPMLLLPLLLLPLPLALPLPVSWLTVGSHLWEMCARANGQWSQTRGPSNQLPWWMKSRRVSWPRPISILARNLRFQCVIWSFGIRAYWYDFVIIKLMEKLRRKVEKILKK